MEREACVCDHGFEISDLCAEIIIIIIIITCNGKSILITKVLQETSYRVIYLHKVKGKHPNLET